MSKQVKQMQMDAMAAEFQGVRDMVVMSVSGLTAQADNRIRLDLRKKGIRMRVVKNSLLRRVFGDAKINLPDSTWAGPTMLVWGGDSIKGLSKEIEAIAKKKENEKFITVKTAVAEGLPMPFARALTMPTRLEAIGEIVAMILGPASSIAGCLTGPASQVASQIQTISEKKTEEAGAPAA
jgi:large subunit ribosomal protein L10